MRSQGLLATGFHLALAAAITPQLDTWNSTYALSTAEIDAANISNATAALVNIAAQFEQTNWATGSVWLDPFYTDIPANASSLPLGSLLKVEEYVNTSFYTVAPTLALSRILFVTESWTGVKKPASAYILWPRLPLWQGPEGLVPLVGFGHGNSGFLAECAPSHIRNLWYHFAGPYALALSGYAVVAPDYAGLGVGQNADNESVVSQPFAFPSLANDLLGSVKAAQAAFSSLTRDYVIVGHSVGGGTAWGLAQNLASAPDPAHLGTVAASPVTNLTYMNEELGSVWRIVEASRGIVEAYSDRVTLPDILTAQGLRILNLLEQSQGCNTVIKELVAGLTAEGDAAKLVFVQDSFLASDLYAEWINTTSNGGKPIGDAPLLVLQGTADSAIAEVVTTTAVNETCDAYPDADLEYLRFDGVDHVPAMYATQRIWLQWISDRFAGKPVERKGCHRDTIYTQASAPRPLRDYQKNINYFLEYANQVYQT